MQPHQLPDKNALQVAELVRQRENPTLTILFGSRARGDHDHRSDVDILLLSPTIPSHQYQLEAEEAANTDAEAVYGEEVPVQLTWDTLESFRHNRRFVNSIHTQAVRDGVIMPTEHEAPDSGEEFNEREYDWSNYDARIAEAGGALFLFQEAARRGLPEANMGRQAQQALEHGLKALLEALGAKRRQESGEPVRYRSTHNIGELLGNVRRHDPELQDFGLSIPPEIYTNYSGRHAYLIASHSVKWLSEQEDCINRTATDVQRIISRAKEVRAQYA